MAQPVYVDGELWAYVPDEMSEDEIDALVRRDYRGPAMEEPDAQSKKGIGEKIGDAASAFSTGLNDWLYAGWFDEVAAALETGKRLASGEIKLDQADEVFHEHAQIMRNDIQRKAAEHPVSTVVGRTIGGVVPILVTAGASAAGQTAAGASAAGQTAAKATPLIADIGKAAAGGALAGAGSAERSEDRLGGAIVGGTIGAGLSAAPAAVKTVGSAVAQSKPGKWAMSLIPGRTPPQKRAAKLIMKAMLEDRNKAIQGAEKRMVDKGGHQFTDAELAGLSPEDKARVLNSQAARYGDMEETVGEMFDPNVQGLARATATVPGPTRVKAEKVLTDRHKGIGDRLMQAVTSNTGKKRGDVVEMVKEMRLTRQKEAEVNYKRAHRASPPQNADELVQPIIETRVGKTAAKKAINLLDRQLALETDPYVKSQIKQDIQYLEAFSQGPGAEAAAPTKELDHWMDALNRARKPIKEPERLASFVRRFGGVRDDRGELKALESTGLRNKNSRYTINEMREMAVEQRFVRPDADDNDFLAAVFEDYKGNPVYSDFASEQLQEMADRDELVDYLAEEGIDALGDLNKARAKIRMKYGDGSPARRQQSEAVQMKESERNAILARGPSMRTLDYLQRGLASISEQEFRMGDSQSAIGAKALQDRLVKGLSKASPEFDTAFSTYREGSRPIDFVELGRKSLKMSDLELTEQLGDMSAADEDAFAAGVAQAFAEALDKGEKALIKKFNDQPGFRRILQSSFSPEAFNSLSSRIEREADMLGTYSSIKQKSAALQAGEDIRSATDDGPADKFVSEVLSSGSLKGPVMRRVGEAWKMARKPGIYNPKVNQELGDLLYSKATPENLKKLDNFLIENTDAPQAQTPARGGDWRVTTPLLESMDPNQRRKDFEAGRDSFAADPESEFDPADGPVPEFSPDFPKGPNRRSPGGPDASGQAQGMGINYNAEPGAGLLEESDDRQWVNDPITGAWRLRRPNDRTRPNQTLNVDIRYGT